MILALDVTFELSFIEVDIAQVARGVSRSLIVKMRIFRVATLAAGRYGFRLDLWTELDGGQEAVSGRSISLFGAGVGPRSKRGQGPPS